METTGTPIDLETLVGAAAQTRGLHRRDDLIAADRAFWELRNLNMHRVVGWLREPAAPAGIDALGAAIRGAISANFKRAWWRGLAFGAVVQLPAQPWTLDELKALVDIRENRVGVLQWVVLVDPASGTATGVHTWEQVFLSSIYRSVVETLRTDGLKVTTAVRGKDGLMRFLTGVSDLQGVSFPEFKDEP